MIGEDDTLTLAGVWGKDAVYLGNSAREIPSDIYVILVSLPSFVTGIFGLSAGELGTSDSILPSLLTSLRQEARAIPSLAFSYTAGSVNRMCLSSSIPIRIN